MVLAASIESSTYDEVVSGYAFKLHYANSLKDGEMGR
jgi:hypothetical protein